MSCREYLKNLQIHVEQSKAKGRFLISDKAIPAGRLINEIVLTIRNHDHVL